MSTVETQIFIEPATQAWLDELARESAGSPPLYELSPQELVNIRANVRYRLVRQLHEHHLTARVYRKAGKFRQAAAELKEAHDLARMIRDMDQALTLRPHH